MSKRELKKQLQAIRQIAHKIEVTLHEKSDQSLPEIDLNSLISETNTILLALNNLDLPRPTAVEPQLLSVA